MEEGRWNLLNYMMVITFSLSTVMLWMGTEDLESGSDGWNDARLLIGLILFAATSALAIYLYREKGFLASSIFSYLLVLVICVNLYESKIFDEGGIIVYFGMGILTLALMFFGRWIICTLLSILGTVVWAGWVYELWWNPVATVICGIFAYAAATLCLSVMLNLGEK